MAGIEYTTTAEGRVAKFVACKGCGHGYGYWMTRRASASNTSWFLIGRDTARNRSDREAKGMLAERLRTEHDLVPCPECGRCPKKMFVAAGQVKYGWVLWVGVGLAVLSIPATGALGRGLTALGRDVKWVGTLGTIVGGLALLGAVGIGVAGYLLKWKLIKGYDPNSEPEEGRLALGRRRAMSPQEYARLAPKPGPQLPPMP